MNQYFKNDQCIISNHGYAKGLFSGPERPVEEKVIDTISDPKLQPTCKKVPFF